MPDTIHTTTAWTRKSTKKCSAPRLFRGGESNAVVQPNLNFYQSLPCTEDHTRIKITQSSSWTDSIQDLGPQNRKQTQPLIVVRRYDSCAPRAAAPGKPVLLFAHGFPSDSTLWRKQVAFFEPLGFGLVVPDLLGYGGTDKPTDPKLYLGSGHAHDIVDILDAESVQQVIAIGHNCGDPISRSHDIAKMIGYDIFAYMRFFVESDAAALIEEHIDSFISLFYPESPQIWKDHLCVDGGARAWLEGDKTTALPAYMTPQNKEAIKKSLLTGGLTGLLCWYKVLVEQINTEDNASISPASSDVSQPLLFIAFAADPVAMPVFGDSAHKLSAKGPVTRKEVGGDHWAIASHGEEINEILLQWVEGL
ncbi:Alpha/Beta hydrolase protein [Mycena filopes]|nr:Alpha/Beta hydrolase protein [Mycena filopes]